MSEITLRSNCRKPNSDSNKDDRMNETEDNLMNQKEAEILILIHKQGKFWVDQVVPANQY